MKNSVQSLWVGSELSEKLSIKVLYINLFYILMKKLKIYPQELS